MKKCLISLLVFFASTAASFACADSSPDPMHYYLFCHCTGTFKDNYEKANQAFWKSYLGKNDEWYFYFDASEAIEKADEEGDKEMVEYLGYLQQYLGIINASRYSWNYPSEEEIAERTATMKQLNVVAAKHYNDAKLSDRYALLFMRTNLYLRQYAINIRFWENRGSNYPDGYIKDMMKNIYANALLSLDRKLEAWNIYAEQNDEESLLWSTRNHSNFAGLKSICDEYPNAPIIDYILQRYVNTLQDALDNMVDYGDNDAEKLSEVETFMRYALDKANDKSIKNKCQWMTAVALLNHCQGKNEEALSQINKALKMPAEKPLAECAERIKFAITTAMLNLDDKKACRSFIDSYKSLLANCKAEKNDYLKNRKAVTIERIMAMLDKKYEAAGKDCEKALLQFIYFPTYIALHYNQEAEINEKGAMDPFDEIEADKLMPFFKNINENANNDPILSYFLESGKLSEDFINDHIGTRLIYENRLEEAIPYLEKVSIEFLKQQNIGLYASQRTLAKDPWLSSQNCNEFIQPPYNINRNMKIDFCKRVLTLKNRVDTSADKETVAKAAYELGSLYCQASYYGNCWFVSQYFVSPYYDCVYDLKEGDFMDISRKYLNIAKENGSEAVRMKALFGLTYTAPDSWISWSYDYELRRMIINKIFDQSQKYCDYMALAQHCKQYPELVTPEISKCDLLKEFIKTNNL